MNSTQLVGTVIDSLTSFDDSSELTLSIREIKASFFVDSLYTEQTIGRNALLLGMFFSKPVNVDRGQAYRDRVRCIVLESIGFSAYTMDDNHSSNIAVSTKHCACNFANKHLLREIRFTWGIFLKFKYIILDYFNSLVRTNSFHCCIKTKLIYSVFI